MGLPDVARDRIEVAALLHDLGKIGIPDRILRKPGRLTTEEKLTMDLCPELGCDILRGCTNDSELLNIVMHANTWYESRRREESPRGDALPMGSRMLSIAGAFDAMTTDHVYRSAMTRDRALEQLRIGSGTQFDPELIVDFERLLKNQPTSTQGMVVDRWLSQLCSEPSMPMRNAASKQPSKRGPHRVRRETRFHTRLLKDLKDGVVFTDAEGTITHWNATMVKMTGISSDAIVGKTWSTKALGLRDKENSSNTECPFQQCMDRAAPVSRSMSVHRKDADPIPVHLQISPVSSEDPGLFGAVIILHDNSVRADLEEQLDELHLKTTIDGLTGVANRAHFDHTLRELTESTRADGTTFSLVICDIDFFKKVNDVHGHPAGDEALVIFAGVLRDHSREGDLVARYGGEEFLLVASNCDNETAAKRAEAIRKALETTPLPSLGGASVTASFGVTEFQAGDEPETVLARADRALLKAKDSGRNRVIQLGSGAKSLPATQDEQAKSSWFSWFDGGKKTEDKEAAIMTPVPANLTIEKLKGFIADHDAEILSVNESQVSIKVNALCACAGGRRRVDARIALNLQLTLSEARPDELKEVRLSQATKVHMCISPVRSRDRRNRDLDGCVERVIASLRSYLMGQVFRPSAE